MAGGQRKLVNPSPNATARKAAERLLFAGQRRRASRFCSAVNRLPQPLLAQPSRVSSAVRCLDIKLVADGVETLLPLDGRNAQVGWNALGVFDLPAVGVRVVVSDKTAGE